MTDLAPCTWPEARELFDERLVALLPLGSTAPHGPHLPLDLEVSIARAQARRAAELLAERGVCAAVLPALSYGLTRLTEGFEGRVTLRPGTLWTLLEDVVESLKEQGVRRVVFVNAHTEPEHLAVLRGVVLDYPEVTRDRPQALFPDWTSEPWVGRLGKSFERGQGHAGRFHTSLALAIAPEVVRTGELARLEPRAVELAAQQMAGETSLLRMGGEDGYSGDPRAASAEQGCELLETLAAIVVEAAGGAWPELFASAGRPG